MIGLLSKPGRQAEGLCHSSPEHRPRNGSPLCHRALSGRSNFLGSASASFLKTWNITKRTQIKNRKPLSFNEKCKSGLASFSKTNPNLPNAGPSHCLVLPTVLPAGKLTQINPSGGKSHRNHTESHHFFHRTVSTILNFVPTILNSFSSRLLKAGKAYSRLLKPKINNHFLFLAAPKPRRRRVAVFALSGIIVLVTFGRVPWGYIRALAYLNYPC